MVRNSNQPLCKLMMARVDHAYAPLSLGEWINLHTPADYRKPFKTFSVEVRIDFSFWIFARSPNFKTKFRCFVCSLQFVQGYLKLEKQTGTFYTLGPLLLIWFQLKSQHGYIITSIIKSGIKLLIHSQTSTFPPTPYWTCDYLSVLG